MINLFVDRVSETVDLHTTGHWEVKGTRHELGGGETAQCYCDLLCFQGLLAKFHIKDHTQASQNKPSTASTWSVNNIR